MLNCFTHLLIWILFFLCVIFSSNFFIFKESARVSHSSTTKVTALKKTSWTTAVIRRSVFVLEELYNVVALKLRRSVFPNLGSNDARAHHQGSGIGRVLYMHMYKDPDSSITSPWKFSKADELGENRNLGINIKALRKKTITK